MARSSRGATDSPPGVLRQEISFKPETVDDPTPEKQSFWELVHTIPETEWWSGVPGEKGYKVYLYRDNPRSNTKGSGYKLLITEPFDVEWVKQRLGGYDYRAMLNDPSGRMVSYVSFSIDAPAKEVEGAAPQAAPSPAADSFQAQVLQEIRESNRQNQSLLLQLIDRISPGAAPAAGSSAELMPIALKGIVEMFANMVPKQSDPVELLVKLKSLDQQKPDILELLIKAKTAGLIPDGAGGSLLGQVDALLAVAEKLGGRGGDRAPGLAEILANKAPEIVQGVGSIIDKASALQEKRLETARTVHAIQRGAQPSPQIIPPAPAPGPPAAASVAPATWPRGAPGLEVEPVTIQPGAAVPLETQQAVTTLIDNFDALKSEVVQAIAHGARGEDIVGFIAVKSDQVMSMFEGASEKDLLAFFSVDPILSQAQKLPRFQACIREMAECLSGDDEGLPEVH